MISHKIYLIVEKCHKKYNKLTCNNYIIFYFIKQPSNAGDEDVELDYNEELDAIENIVSCFRYYLIFIIMYANLGLLLAITITF